MSDQYRDGCPPPKRKLHPLSLALWLLVHLVYLAAWAMPPRGCHRR